MKTTRRGLFGLLAAIPAVRLPKSDQSEFTPLSFPVAVKPPNRRADPEFSIPPDFFTVPGPKIGDTITVRMPYKLMKHYVDEWEPV